MTVSIGEGGVGGGLARRSGGRGEGGSQHQPQYTGATDAAGMRLSFFHATFLLAGLLGSSVASSTLKSTSTPTPTSTLPSTTTASLDNQDASLTTTTATTSLTTKAPVDVLEEVSRLLAQMREVAASMQEAREEHERLAQALSEVTAAVRDMGEHNLHIKKKVRKMSKGLKRNSHNKKIKDGLKSLQRDHQRILHAMSLSGLNITRLHNHTRKHNLTRPHNPSRKNQHGRNRKNHEATSVEVTTKAAAETPEATQEARQQESSEQEVEPEAEASDNHIPDLVVDPPSATDPPLPIDCVEVMQRRNWTSGVYVVQPRGLQPLKVRHQMLLVISNSMSCFPGASTAGQAGHTADQAGHTVPTCPLLLPRGSARCRV